ncbi:MAG: TIM barrel protein [Candidatus Hydrogenedentes bacterium]|nr:TIM barrel protein [Candidatus Hydrogenedentota bacterium]
MDMKRRSFLASCAVGAGAMTALSGTAIAATKESKPFANFPLKIAAPYGWFDGSPAERLAQAAEWGLPAVEWLGPNKSADELREASEKTGVKWSCIGGVGAIAAGQMVQPKEHDRLVEHFRERIEFGKSIGVTTFVGLTGNTRIDATHDQQMIYVIECLRRLAPIAEENGVTLAMEALNPLVDHEGFFLTRTDQTMLILEAVDSPNVKMLFDIYHQQITEGNVTRNFMDNLDRIGHFHVADNPGRKQPGTGELNYSNIFKSIASTNYDGYVALECGYNTGTADEALAQVADCFNWA